MTAYATGVPVAGDPVAGPKIPAAAVVAPVLVQLGPPQHPTSAIIAPDVQAAAVSQRSLTAVHSQLSGASSSAASPYGSERSISQQLATTAYLASSVLALFGVLLLVGRRMWRHGRTIS